MEIEQISKFIQIAMYITIIVGAILLVITVSGLKPDMLDLIEQIYWIDYLNTITQ
ncbi:MAG: hypothetical protein ACFFCM_20370 [Promethearchaeota archaeon]